jgi:tripartite ATP-independent transporter DctP family solute receptor
MYQSKSVIKFSIFLIFGISLISCFEKKDQSSNAPESKKILTLRMGHDMPKNSSQHEAAMRFADIVKSKSSGRMKISLHPAHELGTDHQMIEMAVQGELDIILPPTAKLSTLEPSISLLDMPFLFPSRKDCYNVLDGKTGKKLLKNLERHGLIGVSFWESGFKHFTANRPIRKLSDFKDVNFRIMRSEIIENQFTTLGAKSVVIDFANTRKALKDGVVSGQENPITTIFDMKFHEVQTHLMLSQHAYLSQALIFSKKVYDKLPLDLQEILFNAGKEITDSQRESAQKREEVSKEKIKKFGTKIIEISQDEKRKIIDSLKPILEKYRIKIGTDIVEMALEEISRNEKISSDDILIGLDADLSGNSALSGMAIKRGIEIGISEINNSGGVLGKQLKLIARDNSMVSARGIFNINEFSKHKNLVAVFGGISSPVALSELDVIHKNKIVYLDPWAAATNIVKNNRTPNFVFRISVRDEFAANFLIPKALNISKKVGLLLANNAWGRGNKKGMEAVLKKRGLTPTIVEMFDWGTDSHSEQIDRIYNSGAQVIVYVGNGLEGAKYVKVLSKKKNPIPMISHWGITGAEFPKLAGDALEKIDLRILQTHSFINKKDKLNQMFIKKYIKLYGISNPHEILAPVGTAHAYDLLHILAKAIAKTGSTDREKIRGTLENLGKHRGLVKMYNPPFSPTKHDALDLSDFILTKYSGNNLIPLK